jgi:hypothetical protein
MYCTRVGRVIASVVAAAALLPPNLAQAQESAFAGRWHLNKSLSTLPPGEAVPADLVTDIQRADSQHMRWSITIVDEKGQTHAETFDTPANGEFYSINADTSVAFRLAGSGLQATFKDSDGQTDTLTCTLSGDRRRMTCNGTLTQQNGTVRRYVDVFDRVAR